MKDSLFRKILLVFAAIILCVIIYISFKLITFQLFDSQVEVLQTIKLPNKNYKLQICYSPSDATVESSIQIRKITNDDAVVLSIFERYNYLEDYHIKKDSILITISNTLINKPNYKYTSIKLPD